MRLRLAVVIISVFAALMLCLVVITTRFQGFFERSNITALLHDTVRQISRVSYMHEEGDAPFICWGDSLTSGYGATYRHKYSDLLFDLYHRPTINRGVPSETSTQIAHRMLARVKGEGPEAAIIWAGRNNGWRPDEVEADIAAMVGSLTPGSKYLVLSVLTADEPGERRGEEGYSLFQRLNADLSRLYGPRYVAIRDELIANANLRWTEDAADVAADIVPRSLRTDTVHLNDHGQAIVAQMIESAMISNHW